MAKLLLKGGRVVDPGAGVDGMLDVLIENGVIRRVARDLPVDGAEVFEVPNGAIVAPGFIDTEMTGKLDEKTVQLWRDAKP